MPFKMLLEGRKDITLGQRAGPTRADTEIEEFVDALLDSLSATDAIYLLKLLLRRVLTGEGVVFDTQEEGKREDVHKRELLRWVASGCPDPGNVDMKKLAQAAHTIEMYLV